MRTQVLAELGAANKQPATLEALRAQAEDLAGPKAQRLACNMGREFENLRVHSHGSCMPTLPGTKQSR